MGTRITFISELIHDEAKIQAVEKQLQYMQDKEGVDYFMFEKHHFKGSYYFSGITKTLHPYYVEADFELSHDANFVWVSDENTYGNTLDDK